MRCHKCFVEMNLYFVRFFNSFYLIFLVFSFIISLLSLLNPLSLTLNSVEIYFDRSSNIKLELEMAWSSISYFADILRNCESFILQQDKFIHKTLRKFHLI